MLLVEDGFMSYQLVGGVMAYQIPLRWGAMTGSRPERVFGLTGTETLPRLLREAAVENLPQWAQA